MLEPDAEQRRHGEDDDVVGQHHDVHPGGRHRRLGVEPGQREEVLHQMRHPGRLVLELLERETLDKESVARIFEPLRRRPPRPPWTGSDTRKPSTLPPVISPKEINGHEPERDSEEGTIVLAPGQGGTDVHGPGADPTGGTSEPPSPGDR